MGPCGSISTKCWRLIFCGMLRKKFWEFRRIVQSGLIGNFVNVEPVRKGGNTLYLQTQASKKLEVIKART